MPAPAKAAPPQREGRKLGRPLGSVIHEVKFETGAPRPTVVVKNPLRNFFAGGTLSPFTQAIVQTLDTDPPQSVRVKWDKEGHKRLTANLAGWTKNQEEKARHERAAALAKLPPTEAATLAERPIRWRAINFSHDIDEGTGKHDILWWCEWREHTAVVGRDVE